MYASLLLFSSALAASDGTRLLVMPLTPSESHVDEYHALIPVADAGSRKWASDAPGFECVGDGQFVEVWVRRSNWPSRVPKAVTCSDGSVKAKAKVRIVDRALAPMFAGDGALVLPREKGESSIFRGPPPRADLGVQQGKTGSLSVLCKVNAGPQLEVVAYPAMDDGEGRCTLQTPYGEVVAFPVVVRTIKRTL